MIIKLIDAQTGRAVYVPDSRIVLVEDLGGEFEVTIATPAPPANRTRAVRVTGADARALLDFINRNLFQGGQS